MSEPECFSDDQHVGGRTRPGTPTGPPASGQTMSAFLARQEHGPEVGPHDEIPHEPDHHSVATESSESEDSLDDDVGPGQKPFDIDPRRFNRILLYSHGGAY